MAESKADAKDQEVKAQEHDTNLDDDGYECKCYHKWRLISDNWYYDELTDQEKHYLNWQCEVCKLRDLEIIETGENVIVLD